MNISEADTALLEKAKTLIAEREETADYSRWAQTACLYARGYIRLYGMLQRVQKERDSLQELVNTKYQITITRIQEG